jgi:DNA helicase HerA-like ATPase
LYLILGFLGSGKATFLSRLLEDFQEEKEGFSLSMSSVAIPIEI